jgi:uncharacterized protein YndB with AHSA1/START domain
MASTGSSGERQGQSLDPALISATNALSPYTQTSGTGKSGEAHAGSIHSAPHFCHRTPLSRSAGARLCCLADPSKKRRWFAEGEKANVERFEADFRVGGSEYTRFHFDSGACENDTIYLDIRPNQSIVFAYTMTLNGNRFSSSQATVELLPTENGTQEKGTHLILTEQGAYFEGADGPAIREEGWSVLLNQLPTVLED